MGSLNLICPMCCGETFNDPQSLKYHLLSMTDNLYCPGCSQRSDSVMALIQHLDRCGQDSEQEMHQDTEENLEQETSKGTVTASEVLMDTNIEQINQTFLATVNNNGIMIVGESETIQVDENGDIKVIEKMDTDKSQVDHNSLDFKMTEKLNSIVNETEEKSSTSNSLVTPSTSGTEDKSTDKNIITILSSGSELLDGDTSALINMDHINDVGELDETGLLRVKQEICELEPEAVYSCTSCDMSFNSVLEHIKQFHDGQEVLLEMAEQLDDLSSVPTTSVLPDESENDINTQPQAMNTLCTEECVDSEGRLYTRKVVQIERFWDRTSIAIPPTQSTKAPMIEKFFSNVEGVKVREKRIAPTSVRMYRCNQCLQQFTKLAIFREHACLRGNNRCDSCDQTFATSKALQLHSKIHEGEPDSNQRVFVCTTCGTEFCSHKSLRLHSRMHAPVRARHVDAPEGTLDATFTCPECGKTLSESYKEAHMSLHTGDSVTCTVCNRKFDSADSLAMHAAVHTELSQSHSPTPPIGEVNESIENQKPYQCQHCGRRFTRPHEKVKHERIHTGEKPHVCEVCGKTFRVSYCLTLHMRTHTGVRPYGCQHCGKRFKASSVYNHHLLTHGEERAYTCPYCPKTFKTRVQLAGHKNSHTKPFRCTECSRPFASLYAARAHIQTHKKDNNLKFSCYICGASYGRAFALKDHLKQHGQDTLIPPEPAREEEVREGDNFLFTEEDMEEDKLIIPSSITVAQSSGAEDTD
ncbi:zinc finger protein 595-like isoform X2 [Vespa mandarinia]|uniref:zinc finger protein 595-like isoform X2 n=1 Tax=Vespa mandarinia TaxID=7446 RepID=UPI00160CDDAE|nr:zinc finger protein 595-like isoform X2 [Vespa mandarinia]XP_046827743.1 zinc finger protein 595-like isoform X2 [Vespa crabro]